MANFRRLTCNDRLLVVRRFRRAMWLQSRCSLSASMAAHCFLRDLCWLPDKRPLASMSSNSNARVSFAVLMTLAVPGSRDPKIHRWVGASVGHASHRSV